MPECSMTKKSIEWVAGLFEGEGCFSIHRSKQGDRVYSHLRLSVNSVDEDVIRTLHDSVECGIVGYCRTKSQKENGWQGQWHWRVHGKAAENLAMLLMPHLHERRKKRFIEIVSQVYEEKLERADLPRAPRSDKGVVRGPNKRTRES